MSIFTPILERMAAGQVDQLYAQVRIRMDGDTLILDKNQDQTGRIYIESVNQVPVCGAVFSLCSGLSVHETTFQGNSELHYSFSKADACVRNGETEPGILIQYNGGELIIPVRIVEQPLTSAIVPEHVEAEWTEEGIRRHMVKTKLAAIGRLSLSYLILKEKQENSLQLTETLSSLHASIEELVSICPKIIRYRLYEAIIAVKCHDVSRAISLDKAMRNMVASARKKHLTEFLLLRYLEHEIAKANQDAREANEMRKQVQTFLPLAMKQNPQDADLICLLGSDCLNMIMSDPHTMWDSLHDAYDDGCNSSFLYLQGLRILQNHMLEMDPDFYTDSFVLHCLCQGARNGLLNRELAGRIMKESSIMSAPYLYYLYRNIYELYPEQEILSALCRLMIRMDVKGPEAHSYYKKGIQMQLRMAKLFDYYMHTFPSGADQMIAREVLLYYAADEYVNPAIYLKLCQNLIRFYQNDVELMDLYEPHMEAFVRTQLSYKRYSGELAELSDYILRADTLDTKLAESLYPLLHMVSVKGDVADGSVLLYENGVYDQLDKIIFHDGKVIMSMPSGLGKIELLDPQGHAIGGISLEITPLIQNEALIDACRQLCSHMAELQLIDNARILHDYASSDEIPEDELRAVDVETCVRYLKDDHISLLFKKDVIVYIRRSVGLYELLQYGMLEDAITIWSHFSDKELDQDEVFTLVEQMMLHKTCPDQVLMDRFLMWLLERDGLDTTMLGLMAQNGCRPMEIQIQILAACREQGIPHQELSANILKRQLLTEEKDWPTLQIAFDELVNHDSYTLLNQAAMSMLCHGTLFYGIEPRIDLAAFIQSEMMHSGSSEGISDLLKLAFVKQVQKETVLSGTLVNVRRQFCQSLKEKGYVLDFLQRESVRLGIPSYPVITVNLSKEGPFGESMEEMAYVHNARLWIEYRIDGSSEIMKSPAFHSYGCLYSAEVMVFANETVSYRVRLGERYTSWMSMEKWDYPIYNEEGLSDRYVMLQRLAIQAMNGEIQAEQIQSYEVTMDLIHGLDQIM